MAQLLAAAVALAVLATPALAQVRLATEGDRAAFRAWFVLLADLQFDQPAAEVTDCAGLVRFAFREALRAHTPDWARRLRLPVAPSYPDVVSAPKPGPSGWPLFRVTDGTPAAYAEFADAQTIVRLNARPLGRKPDALRPGDLIYYRQASQRQPDHLMVFVGRSHFEEHGDDWVVYHTGPDDQGSGEVRKVRLSDLRRHPAPRWRPEDSNHSFIGVFRLALL